MEFWNRFIHRFEIAFFGAGLKQTETEGTTTRKGKQKAKEGDRFELEQRKAALLLDKMGEIGMDIFESWDIAVEEMQYEELKNNFKHYFLRKKILLLQDTGSSYLNRK